MLSLAAVLAVPIFSGVISIKIFWSKQNKLISVEEEQIINKQNQNKTPLKNPQNEPNTLFFSSLACH